MEGSWGWGMMVPLEQRALEEEEKQKLQVDSSGALGFGDMITGVLWGFTFNMSKGTEGPSGTAATLLHVIALGGFIDL